MTGSVVSWILQIDSPLCDTVKMPMCVCEWCESGSMSLILVDEGDADMKSE